MLNKIKEYMYIGVLNQDRLFKMLYCHFNKTLFKTPRIQDLSGTQWSLGSVDLQKANSHIGTFRDNR